jgi:ribosomal protein S2
MKSYIKILLFFKKINIHRTSVGHPLKDTLAYNFIFSYRNHKIYLDLNKTLISLYSTIKVVQYINNNNVSVLFVGNTSNALFFDIINTKGFKNIFFIQKWVPGILSNWDSLASIVKKQDNLLFKNSYKLRFLRFFYNTFNKKKPNLVIVCGNSDTTLISSECFNQDIPVVSLGNLVKTSEAAISYQVPANVDNFLSSSLFLQLYIGQVESNKGLKMKTKDKIS